MAKCNHLNLSYHHHRLTVQQQQQQQLVLNEVLKVSNFGGSAKSKKLESINEQNCVSEAYRCSKALLMSLNL